MAPAMRSHPHQVSPAPLAGRAVRGSCGWRTASAAGTHSDPALRLVGRPALQRTAGRLADQPPSAPAQALPARLLVPTYPCVPRFITQANQSPSEVATQMRSCAAGGRVCTGAAPALIKHRAAAWRRAAAAWCTGGGRRGAQDGTPETSQVRCVG